MMIRAVGRSSLRIAQHAQSHAAPAATRALRTAAPRLAARSTGSTGSGTKALAGAGLLLAGAAAASGNSVEAQAPRVDFAKVRSDIEATLDDESYDDGSFGPVYVRLAWHCSGTYAVHDKTGGSDGATMRYSPEAKWGANAGLDVARSRLESIKAKHAGLSHADLYTLAGAVAIEAMGGPSIKWRPGRTDHTGPSSDNAAKKSAPDGRLPDAAQGASHMRDIFMRMGFDDQEIVALAGAHALGRCHTNRSGFDGPWTRAPTTFSNEYFRVLLEEKWEIRPNFEPKQYRNRGAGDLMMTEADMAFVRDEQFRKWVEIYAKDEERFFADFARAFTKLEELGCNTLQRKKFLGIF